MSKTEHRKLPTHGFKHGFDLVQHAIDFFGRAFMMRQVKARASPWNLRSNDHDNFYLYGFIVFEKTIFWGDPPPPVCDLFD